MTTADAGTYRRLDESLKAHRGDEEAYARLGAQMRARRHLLNPRYGNRHLFVRERLIPLGLKESAARKLVYDMEGGKLQGRGGYSAGNMLALAQAYRVTPDSVIAVLDGGDLDPSRTDDVLYAERARPQPAPVPADDGWRPPLPEDQMAAAWPHFARIAEDMRLWTARYAREHPETNLADIQPTGADLFGEGSDDAADWDRRAGRFTAQERAWLVAAARAREEARQRQRGAG